MATTKPIKFPTRIDLDPTVKWEKSFKTPIAPAEEKAEETEAETEIEESAVSEDSEA